jgi:polyhydroxyalkanoate synthesis regulator phasin
MPNDTLTLLRETLRKRGANTAVISSAAEELCKIIDHINTQHWQDRDRYHERIKQLEDRVAKLEASP